MALSRANYVLDVQPWEVCHPPDPQWPRPFFTEETWIQRGVRSPEPDGQPAG